MARYVLRFAVVVVAGGLLTGCGGSGSMAAVLRGNLAYGRGDYQSALVHYLEAEQDARHRGWLLYNTGNVYYALGEQEAALSAWEEARRATVDPETGSSAANAETLLIHAASHNRGVLFYQRGEYESAYAEFRYALSVNARSVAAKQNLELALQKMQSLDQADQAGEGSGTGEGDAEPGPDP
ncbi:MAG: tetratricopeptide repeat protein, partial [Spirochaetota bacterium]